MKIKIIAAIICLVQLYSSTVRSDMAGLRQLWTETLLAGINKNLDEERWLLAAHDKYQRYFSQNQRDQWRDNLSIMPSTFGVGYTSIKDLNRAREILEQVRASCSDENLVNTQAQLSINKGSTLEEIIQNFYASPVKASRCNLDILCDRVGSTSANYAKIKPLFDTSQASLGVSGDCAQNQNSFKCLCPQQHQDYLSKMQSGVQNQQIITSLPELVAKIFNGGAQDALNKMQKDMQIPPKPCVIDQGNNASYNAGPNAFANGMWRAFNFATSCQAPGWFTAAFKENFCKFIHNDTEHHKEFIDRWLKKDPNEKQWFDKFEHEWCPGVLTVIKNRRDARDKAATGTDRLATSIFEGGAQDLLRTTPGTETCVIEQGNTKSYSAGDNSLANAIWRAFNLLQSCSLFTKQEPVRTSYEERKILPPLVSDESLGLGAIGIGER